MRLALATTRWTALLAVAALLLGMAGVAAPPAAAVMSEQHRACPIMEDLAEQKKCEAQLWAQREARKQAREQLRERRRVADDKLDSAWRDAVKDARKTRLRDIVSPRLLAVVVGLMWFWVALRRQRRRRQRP